jgi:tryptophan synthase alpha chain
MLGYPDKATSIALAQAISGAGADVIELGVPFSDPLAEGKTIQHASQLALEQGTTLQECLDMARAIASATTVPLVFMGYYNPFLQMGLDTACERMSAAGVSGLIIPDLPVEEASVLIAAGKIHGVNPIFLVTPTSPDERIARIVEAAHEAESGFIYCVSLSGVTGARDELRPELPAFVGRVRERTGDLPLCVGFGIARPEHAVAVAQIADGIAVGSALINAFDHAPAGEGAETVVTLARSLRNAARKNV